MRAKELETLAEKLKFEDNSVEDNRYDIMSELRDKAMQGFEILEEHTVNADFRRVYSNDTLIVTGAQSSIRSSSCSRSKNADGDERGVRSMRGDYKRFLRQRRGVRKQRARRTSPRHSPSRRLLHRRSHLAPQIVSRYGLVDALNAAASCYKIVDWLSERRLQQKAARFNETIGNRYEKTSVGN